MIFFYTPPPVIEPITIDLEEKQELGYIVTQTRRSTSKPTSSSTGVLVLDLINQTRQENGLKKLTVSSRLNASTANKCQDMNTYKYWSHDNPNGTTWLSFIRAQGVTGYASEILASYQPDDYYQHNMWLNSPSHRGAILGNWNYFGVAKCGVYTVVHFSQ